MMNTNPQGMGMNYYGATYAVPAKPQPKGGNPLSQEDINRLRQMSGSERLDIKISPLDLLISRCTHREKDGRSTLVNIGGNRWRCTICNQEFNMVDLTPEEVTDKVNGLIDVLQTAKAMYFDAPDKLIEEYFQMIPLLLKLPAVWNVSLNNFAKYENWQQAPEFSNNGYYPGFTAMHNLLTGQFAAPGYGYQPQQNMYMYQQPVVTPQPTAGYYQQPQYQVDPSGNPVAYGAPVAPNPGVMPAPQVPAPTAPAPVVAPAAQTEVQQTQVFNV